MLPHRGRKLSTSTAMISLAGSQKPMAETLQELKAELAFLEKRMSKIAQHPELAHTAVDYANKIAALREQIKAL
jgi:hypothetical protein